MRSLFKALKGSKKYITWTDECAEAFKNLKEYMSKAPLLSKPEVGDTLIVYMSISASVVSSVLIRMDGSIEQFVYYASKALQDAETQYSNIEKLALALVMSTRKLRPYFQAHFIIPAKKGQAVADFIVEFTYPVDVASTPKTVAPFPPEARKVSNNEVEYKALLAGLRLAKHLGVKQIDIFSDSQLVVNQVTNNFDANDSSMASYLVQTQILLKHFHYQIT
ncbi:uncharacterized protein [Malus domestica]|uniref:uncharacterized protein n=1 Tax=Malus domestica TaxID=3750 RepID=UPI00397589A8